MIPLAEAACPKCFNKTDVAYPLNFNASTKTYGCTHDLGHQFIEDESGFLKSKY